VNCGESIIRKDITYLYVRNKLEGWRIYGIVPPHYLLSQRKFLKVVLEPPSFEPGSWRGAGNVLVDYDTHEFWLTTRPRKVGVRGYGVEIYRSTNGEDYSLTYFMSKEEVSELCGRKIKSIEGQQMLLDPLTGRYYLYLAIDDEKPGWCTLLLSADDPRGPWTSERVVLERGEDYDLLEARDSTISFVDGKFFALYKANSGKRVNMALAVSSDGKSWRKLGVLEIDGKPQPDYLLLYGNIFSSGLGAMFIGAASRAVVNGAAVAKTFEAYIIDYRNINLETIFVGEWTPKSPYERKDYPIHSYVDIVYDPFKDRYLIYVESIDPTYSKDLGVNLEVDRVILYEVPL